MEETKQFNATGMELNPMGYAPIHKLLVKMSVPLMISMLIMAMYNIVDSVFVSRINEDALAAVTMVFPIQNLNAAFAVGSAVGMSALLSRYLGAGEYDKVNKVAHNGIIIAIINFLLFIVLGMFARQFMEFQTDNERIIQYGVEYMQIICWLSFAPMISIMLERCLQGTGKTQYIMVIQASGCIFNIIWDPILIFGLLGFPEMGVKGAAIATVLGQLLSLALGLIFNLTKNKEITFSFSSLKPEWHIMKEIYKIALPSIVMQSIGSIMNFCVNQVLVKYSTTAVATFGVYFKLQSFMFMPVFGMNSGTVPIIAYNYGAGHRDRIYEAMKLGLRYAVAWMCIGTVLFWIFPTQLLSLFDASPEMLDMGTKCLRIIAINFPFAAYAIMRGAVFQALGKSIYSMYVSLVRQLLVLVPLTIIISLIFKDVNAVWWAWPIAEIFGMMMSVLFSIRIKKQIIDRIE